MGTKTTPSNSEATDDQSVQFSVEGLRDGFVECVPIALGVAGYGIVFGVLARSR